MLRVDAPGGVTVSASNTPVMPRMMDHRLRRSSDFDRVSNIGKGRANELVVLRYAPNDVDTMRAGYAVSKRVGGAVTRNAVKRRLRAAVRKLGPSESGVDLVFIARPQITQAGYRGIEDAVADVLKRAGLRDGEVVTGPAGISESHQD